MTRTQSSSVLWLKCKRAVMLGVILSGLWGRGYGFRQAVTLTFTTQTNNTATCGNSNGSITVTNVVGGNGNYQYSIDGGPFQSSATFNNIAAGNHTIDVEDNATPPDQGTMIVGMGS